MITNHNSFLRFLKLYVLATIGYQSLSRKLFKPWSKNLFNAVSLRSMQMLARPLSWLVGNLAVLVSSGCELSTVQF